MQQHKAIEEYLDSVIPEKLSRKVSEEIRAEIEGHICDRAEFYAEIGYDEDEAVKRAIEHMGEADSVRKNFNALYKDSTWKGVLLFIVICACNLFSITTELGYMYFVDPIMPWMPTVVVLFVFLALSVALLVYTIKCIRQRLDKQLIGIISAFVLITMGSLVTSGIFMPVINAASLIFRYIINGPSYVYDEHIHQYYLVNTIVNIVLLVVFTTVTFAVYDKRKGFRTKPYRLSLKQITALLSVISVCFLIVYGFAFEKYEWGYTLLASYETREEDYLSNIVSEQREVYNNIEIGSSFSETEKEIGKKGFVRKEDHYSENVSDSDIGYEMREYLLKKIEENNIGEISIGNRNGYISLYYYTNYMKEKSAYDDVISCIIIAYDYDGKITYKMFVPDMNGMTIEGSYLSYTHGDEAQKWFDGLKKGDDCETAMSFIRRTNSFIIEDEKYDGSKSYYIEMNCYYPQSPDFIDFLHGSYDSRDYMYVFKITARNGKIEDFEIAE